MGSDNAKSTARVIDRSLPEIHPLCSKLSRLDMLEFCWMLKSAGTDIIEISGEILAILGKLPEGLDFIVRVRTEDDVALCVRSRVKRIVLDEALLESGAAGLIKSGDFTAALEVRANSIDGICRLEQLVDLCNFPLVGCIRILGLDAAVSDEWLGAARKVRSVTGRLLDICAGNAFSMGTSTSLEGMAGGMDFVTASFGGYGGFTPLEELLSALKARYEGMAEADLGMLPGLRDFISGHVRRRLFRRGEDDPLS